MRSDAAARTIDPFRPLGATLEHRLSKPLRSLRSLWGVGDSPEQQANHVSRGNRRRLVVFAATFAIVMLVGQAWNFSRPTEYRAQMRLQVSLPEVGRVGRSASSSYETKLQLLNSRPLLTRLADALARQGAPAGGLGADPAGQLKSMLQVLPVAGSEVAA